MSRSVLIIGGTRNLGHFTAIHFRAAGDRVAVLNRGITPDQLGEDIERIRADRTQAAAFREAIGRREFDLVVDTALYTGPEAGQAIEILDGRVGHYLVISTGQVYLVRSGLIPPFVEAGYEGPVIPAPTDTPGDYAGWEYGVQKREAEDRLFGAWRQRGFPVTTLRLPMVHSERDHYDRVRNCLARLSDGGPLLVPADERPRLRHVWVHDVVRAIGRIGNERLGVGSAYNLSQHETVSLPDFLDLFATRLQQRLRLVEVSRDRLSHRGLLPECAPFSGRWMSELDNGRSVHELGIAYTPLTSVADALVNDYLTRNRPKPSGYQSRPEELELAQAVLAGMP
jgi:nucleoside-diphosphate-sugar epimerase